MDSFLHNLDWILPLRSPLASGVAYGFTWFGSLPFFLIFISLGFWLNDRERFLRLTILLAVSALICTWLKDYWQDPRPDIHYSLNGRLSDSFARPSRHAMTATVLWFWLALEVKRTWMWALAMLMVVGVSFSRLYLGVHDVDDILTGMALGLATLFAFRWTLGARLKAFRELQVWVHLVVIAALFPLLWPIWPTSETPPIEVTAALFLLAGALLGVEIDRRIAPNEVSRFSIIRCAYSAIALYSLFAFFGLLGKVGSVREWALVALLGLYITAAVPFAIRTLAAFTERAIGRAR